MSGDARSRDATTFGELIDWAWRATPAVHESRTNLVIHLVAVPMFVAGHLAVVVGVVTLSGVLGAIGILSIVLSLVLQKRGV